MKECKYYQEYDDCEDCAPNDCENCGIYKIYQQGRNDGIDEFEKAFIGHLNTFSVIHNGVSNKNVIWVANKLKEKN